MQYRGTQTLYIFRITWEGAYNANFFFNKALQLSEVRVLSDLRCKINRHRQLTYQNEVYIVQSKTQIGIILASTKEFVLQAYLNYLHSSSKAIKLNIIRLGKGNQIPISKDSTSENMEFHVPNYRSISVLFSKYIYSTVLNNRLYSCITRRQLTELKLYETNEMDLEKVEVVKNMLLH